MSNVELNALIEELYKKLRDKTKSSYRKISK